jgi:quinohemoprotein ethanol dehydrogenase
MKLHSIRSAVLVGCVLLSCGCHNDSGPAGASIKATAMVHGTADVDEARIVNADKEPQNWLSVSRNYAEDRYSPLASINEGNVGRLGLAWFVDLDTKIGSEVTPLVVDGVMYTVGAWK